MTLAHHIAKRRAAIMANMAEGVYRTVALAELGVLETALLNGDIDPHIPEETIRASVDAMKHVLTQIKDKEEVCYLLGAGTESFALLTAAVAKLVQDDVDTIREHYLPGSAAIHSDS